MPEGARLSHVLVGSYFDEPTTIGRSLEPPIKGPIAAAVGLFVVAADLLLVWRGEHSYTCHRAALPVLALIAYLSLSRGDLATTGLVLHVRHGIGYWAKAMLAIGLVVSVGLTLSAIAFLGVGAEIPIRGLPLSLVPSSLMRMCVMAPLIEEATYRLALCTAAAAVLRPRQAIMLSGACFALLHVLYGNPGADNVLAGFFLAWAYFKSGSILVPILLHSLGNLCVLAGWVALWYLGPEWLIP